jgi:hypothetical protein
MVHPAGESDACAIKVDFDHQLMLEFHGGVAPKKTDWVELLALVDGRVRVKPDASRLRAMRG